MGALKMTDQIAGHELAGHDKYLFIFVSTNPSNFSSIVENLMKYLQLTVNCYLLAATLSTRIDSLFC